MPSAPSTAVRARSPAPTTRVLPVAPATVGARIVAADGSPIWPVGDAATLAALSRIAELFDAGLVVTEPRRVAQAVQAGRRIGTVVSVGSEADDAAALYAHLTGRRFVAAADPARLALRQPGVVVAPQRLLTPRFLGNLYADQDRAPGLIAAGSHDALVRQALVRAAALRLSGASPRRAVDVMPDAAFGRVEDGLREAFGGQADRHLLHQALGRGSEVLTIFTAGDGLDAVLGPLILCPMAGASGRTGPAPPPCVASGNCHRLQLPLAEAAASEGLVPPEALAARVLVLHACWGIQPAGSLYDQAWGYGYRLANSDRLGAIITTWQITIGAPDDTQMLVHDLARGAPLGTAVARFNQSPRARRTGQRMCLLGDPDLRLFPAGPRALALRPAPTRPRPRAEDRRQLAFLAAYLDVTDPKPVSRTTHAAARSAVTACQRLVWSGLAMDAPGEMAGAVMRSAMLDFLGTHGTIPAYHWMSLGHPLHARESGRTCAACGQPDNEVVLRLRVDGSASRRLTLCPRCGLTEDRPAAAGRLDLAVSGRFALLRPSADVGALTGALLFRPHGRPAYGCPWQPSGEEPSRLAMQAFNEGGPAEAGQLLLFVMDGAALQVARTPYGPTLAQAVEAAGSG